MSLNPHEECNHAGCLLERWMLDFVTETTADQIIGGESPQQALVTSIHVLSGILMRATFTAPEWAQAVLRNSFGKEGESIDRIDSHVRDLIEHVPVSVADDEHDECSHGPDEHCGRMNFELDFGVGG